MVTQLLESIIFIIDSVLPLLRKLPPSIVDELEQDLKQMILRHSFLAVVHACIKYCNLLPLFSLVRCVVLLTSILLLHPGNSLLINSCNLQFSNFFLM